MPCSTVYPSSSRALCQTRSKPCARTLLESADRIWRTAPGGDLPDARFLSVRLILTTASTKVLAAHVPLPLADKVDQMASTRKRSRSWIMEQALSAWIAQEETRDRLTQEALANVDAGLLIDHLAVQAWADSLGTDRAQPLPR
ncbi:CopG family ribbon-helix-helix protein [Thauera sp.]|uniref:CopG family ribbon-helix-helix protein n=1 Tax=unclassified Thauera TaxID=2609274 RepID=UPI00338DB161